MSNSTIIFVIIVCCTGNFLPFVSAMIKENCDTDNLILPFHEENPWPKTSLPHNLVPRHYTLQIQPFLPPTGNFTFEGRVSIVVNVEIKTTVFVLNSWQLKISEPTISVIKSADKSKVPIKSFHYMNPDLILIYLKEELLPKSEYTISMDYTGHLNDAHYGFYKSSYNDKVVKRANFGDLKWLAVSRFKPTGARAAFPSFDEPHLKATFNIIVVRPPSMTAISNMPTYKSETRANGDVADFFWKTKRMSTYQVVFIVSPFTGSTKKRDFTLRMYTRDSSRPLEGEAIRSLYDSMRYFEEYFKILYPLPEISLISIPDSVNPVIPYFGLMVMSEKASLYIEKMFHGDHQKIMLSVARGAAHQWFGGLVTPNWWNEKWLDDGLATYYAEFAANHHDKTRKFLEQSYAYHTVPAMLEDSLESTHALLTPVTTTNEILALSRGITHKKGAAILNMLSNFLGELAFYTGVRQYLIQNSYLTTVQEDLWYQLDKEQIILPKVNVKAVMKTWTIQKGFPVVNVQRDYYFQKAILSQQRFISSEVKNERGKELWHIPLSFTTQALHNFKNTMPKFWMSNKGENVTLQIQDGVPLREQWMLFNIKAVTYCLINYDEENWKLLSNYFESENATKIPHENRAQLVHDSLLLAKGRHLNYQTALEMVRQVMYTPDNHLITWQTFQYHALYLSERLRFTDASVHYERYLQDIIWPFIELYNMTVKYGGNLHLTSISHRLCLGIAKYAGLDDFFRYAATFYNMMVSKSAALDNGFEPIIFCGAIRFGDSQIAFNQAINNYLTTTWPSDKVKLVRNLECVTKKEQLNTIFDKILEPGSGVHESNFQYMFSIATSSIEGKPVAIDFVKNKLQQLKARFPTTFQSKIKIMLEELGDSFQTTDELKQMKLLIAHVNKELNLNLDLTSAIRKVEENIKWLSGSFKEINSYLKRNYHTVKTAHMKQ